MKNKLQNNELLFFKKKINGLASAEATTPATQTEVQFFDKVESEDKTSQSTQTEEELLEAITSAASVTQSTQTKGKWNSQNGLKNSAFFGFSVKTCVHFSNYVE